jgi:hypothetical protein
LASAGAGAVNPTARAGHMVLQGGRRAQGLAFLVIVASIGTASTLTKPNEIAA